MPRLGRAPQDDAQLVCKVSALIEPREEMLLDPHELLLAAEGAHEVQVELEDV